VIGHGLTPTVTTASNECCQIIFDPAKMKVPTSEAARVALYSRRPLQLNAGMRVRVPPGYAPLENDKVRPALNENRTNAHHLDADLASGGRG